MKKTMIALLILLILTVSATAQYQAIPPYYSQNDFLMGSSTGFYDGLLGFTNPANLSFLHNAESRFFWSTEGTKAGSFKDWGLFMAVPHVGFGVIRRDMRYLKTTDYRISLGMGDDRASLGIAYGWSGANIDSLKSEKVFKSNLVIRPLRYLSLGLGGEWSFESAARQGVAEIGLRPLGDSKLTFFGDFAMREDTRFNNAPWSAGAAVELIPGIDLTGRYFESEAFTIGLLINFGRGAIAQQMHYDSDQEYAYNTYSISSGGMRPSIFPNLIEKDRRYLKINLKGRVSYLGYMFGDSGYDRFIEIVRNIKAAGDDPRVAAIALNVSEAKIAPEHAWEIREALREFQSKGKKVITFMEYTGLRNYYLASVGDEVVIDPSGFLLMPGYTMSKTYLKGTLEKLGLGFDEWRFYKYKSAMEVLSRENMSAADREQYQAFLDDWYDQTQTDICRSRGMDAATFNALIDNQAVFTPDIAQAENLIDMTGRWSDVDKIVEDALGHGAWAIDEDQLEMNALPPKYWGGDPRVAVVYGLGECALDSGIKARWLSRQFKKLARNRSIKAVVFRVDSPGGDALASDLVAEAMKECAAKKPVIVTQGQVAGSGGYWISMYGDKILAGPTTITGSIGVIGGWIWDKGISGKLGLTSDYVARGEHADVGYGVRIPLLNIMVPARNLTTDERAKVESVIRTFYDEFVAKVAAGRHMSEEKVRKIAEGHFYSGIEGKEIGLVDQVGGLMMAIEIAKQQAGIAGDQRVDITEIPSNLGFFPPIMPFDRLSLGTKIDTDDPAIKYIKMLNDSPVKAIPMMQPGTYPTAE